ncbi:glycoside hydrolase family 6 protein [Streptomyces sp. P9(2023)]|uniref:glycoside hydrolase family 6 protein n=1 Tax=Streptomyces sp. P9(2023) TaxID=3064394 RepID=UPI0028F446E4|nr:glycoside hydrolase family 6 protein [Streptomyces sp. P9(2023)]MDT9689789.1 glycoside hydrolase family 6 protein [Streptomyces sp. P9(2023)]
MSRRTSTTAVLTLVTALLLTGCGGTDEPARTPVGPPSARGEAVAPASGSPFWVDPDSDAARQVRQYEAEGRTEDARLLKRIAERPVADWPAGDDPVPDISKAVRGAAADKRTVVLVAYNIPHRDCGMYSAGGSQDAQAYRTWVDSFAAAIGDAPAIVVLEPDAVPHAVDGCTPAQYHDERYQLLSEAVDRLKRQPNTRVYLDAGNPRWIDDPGKLVEPLRRAGIAQADGFSLNVSNFETNDRVKGFGAKLSGLLGGAHFTVDTSRNGDGPAPGNGEDAWCNPPGRALGVPPTDRTGDKLVDAYLWIKRPGESDGTCRGGPSAGTWWPDYALGLARRAKA